MRTSRHPSGCSSIASSSREDLHDETRSIRYQSEGRGKGKEGKNGRRKDALHQVTLIQMRMKTIGGSQRGGGRHPR